MAGGNLISLRSFHPLSQAPASDETSYQMGMATRGFLRFQPVDSGVRASVLVDKERRLVLEDARMQDFFSNRETHRPNPSALFGPRFPLVDAVARRVARLDLPRVKVLVVNPSLEDPTRKPQQDAPFVPAPSEWAMALAHHGVSPDRLEVHTHFVDKGLALHRVRYNEKRIREMRARHFWIPNYLAGPEAREIVKSFPPDEAKTFPPQSVAWTIPVDFMRVFTFSHGSAALPPMIGALAIVDAANLPFAFPRWDQQPEHEQALVRIAERNFALNLVSGGYYLGNPQDPAVLGLARKPDLDERVLGETVYERPAHYAPRVPYVEKAKDDWFLPTLSFSMKLSATQPLEGDAQKAEGILNDPTGPWPKLVRENGLRLLRDEHLLAPEVASPKLFSYLLARYEHDPAFLYVMKGLLNHELPRFGPQVAAFVLERLALTLKSTKVLSFRFHWLTHRETKIVPITAYAQITDMREGRVQEHVVLSELPAGRPDHLAGYAQSILDFSRRRGIHLSHLHTLTPAHHVRDGQTQSDLGLRFMEHLGPSAHQAVLRFGDGKTYIRFVDGEFRLHQERSRQSQARARPSSRTRRSSRGSETFHGPIAGSSRVRFMELTRRTAIFGRR